MELGLLHSLPYQREYISFPVELAAKIAVRIVARILQENPGHFDLVEWVLFDSYTESVYEAEVDKIGRACVGKECRSRWSPYH